jgi:nitroreductase
MADRHNHHTSLGLLLIAVAAVCSSVLFQNNGNVVDRTSTRTTVGSSGIISLSVADAFAPPPTFPSRHLPFRLEGMMMVSACKMRNTMGTSYPHKTHHVLSSSTTGHVGHHTADTEKEPILVNNSNQSKLNNKSLMDGFDSIVNKRYACTRFQRYQEPTLNTNGTEESSTTDAVLPQAAISDQTVVKSAYKCLELSQRAPTGFNAQPYRVILVHSKEDKERLSQYCLGRNADRVRDSDCTAVFLADRECGRDGKRYTNFLVDNMDPPPPPPQNEDDVSDDARPLFNSVTHPESTTIARANTSRTRRPLSSKALFKLRMLIMLFSSGYPLPRFLNVPFSWGVRTAVSILSFLARCLQSMRQRFRILSKLFPSDIQLLPTLSSAETWAQKNTMLAAMIYMLACTSRGLATCPMEGIDAAGVRKVLGIPRGRYSIPLIVSTGTPYRRSVNELSETDDVGMSHGDDGNFSPRYKLDEVVFGNNFGVPCDLA